VVVVLGGAVCGRLQLRGQDVEHHLHVPVATGLHILVKLQYAAAAACRGRVSGIRILSLSWSWITHSPHPKGRGQRRIKDSKGILIEASVFCPLC